jgi:hypothetical protein
VVDREDPHRAPGQLVHLRAAVDARDAALRAGQQLGREVAERADHLRLDQLDLAVEVGLAGVDLVWLRVAVARRPAEQDVRDEDVRAPEADLLQELVQQLPGTADEREALKVLVHAGGLTDEHQVGVGVPGAEHHRRPALMERAAHAPGRFVEEIDEVGAALLCAA